MSCIFYFYVHQHKPSKFNFEGRPIFAQAGWESRRTWQSSACSSQTTNEQSSSLARNSQWTGESPKRWSTQNSNPGALAQVVSPPTMTAGYHWCHALAFVLRLANATMAHCVGISCVHSQYSLEASQKCLHPSAVHLACDRIPCSPLFAGLINLQIASHQCSCRALARPLRRCKHRQ